MTKSSTPPRPEHPRPDCFRENWLNLNGRWEYAEDDRPFEPVWNGNNPLPEVAPPDDFPETITVPFCRESRLSGLERTGFMRNAWYRRQFRLPDWSAPRVRLHVGACDWLARVWVNGQYIGHHAGGSAAFCFDVTDALTDGDNEVIVHAYDDARSGYQALGKQSDRPESHGIFYTRTTGIWQTVWLEGVGASYIRDFHSVYLDQAGQVLLRTEIARPVAGLELTATLSADGATVAAATRAAGGDDNGLLLSPEEPRLWSPEEPYLYDLRLRLARGGRTIDEVTGHVGLRTVTVQGAAVLINNKPVFQRLVLDQGFFPDGIWTAPSDGELRADIERSMALGFNGARLHQKVAEPRFLHWADRLGYLLWGEFPDFQTGFADARSHWPFLAEWEEILRRDRNHPSIIGWCPFNETPPEAAGMQRAVHRLTRTLDPTRPVLETSGWTHHFTEPEILDAHDYQQEPEILSERWHGRLGPWVLPQRFRAEPRDVPFFISECGGIGWNVEAGWGYGNTPKDEAEFLARLRGIVESLAGNRFLFGFCYTQLTDIEQERNGLYTYDRQVKFDPGKIRECLRVPAAYESDPPHTHPPAEPAWRVLVEAIAGRGADEAEHGFAWDGEPFDVLVLAVRHGGGAAVHLNESAVWSKTHGCPKFLAVDLTGPAQALLKKGTNVFALRVDPGDEAASVEAALLTGRLPAGEAR